MKLNFGGEVKLHNRYTFKLVDSVTGKVKQEAIAENVVLNTAWTYLSGTSQDRVMMCSGIAFGNGTGTPAASDTALFNELFRLNGTNIFSLVSSDERYPTSAYTFSMSVPASASYVGTLKEVGLICRRTNSSTNVWYYLWTHALLKDAEGNPIAITKTDLDVLIVTATIYVTFGSTDGNFTWVSPGRLNAVSNAFIATSQAYVPFRAGTPLACCSAAPVRDDGTISSVTVAASVGSTTTFNTSNKTLSIASTRLGRDAGNGVYYKAFVIGNNTVGYLGGVVLPNTDIFPEQTIAGLPVGTGDGSTTNYSLPLDYIVQGSDKLYVNGVEKTRGVDYTIDNVNALGDYSVSLSSFLSQEDEYPTDLTIPDIPTNFGEPAFIKNGNGGTAKNAYYEHVAPLTLDEVDGYGNMIKSYTRRKYSANECDELKKITDFKLNDIFVFTEDRLNADIWSLAAYDTRNATPPLIGNDFANVNAVITAMLTAYYSGDYEDSVMVVDDAGAMLYWHENSRVLALNDDRTLVARYALAATPSEITIMTVCLPSLIPSKPLLNVKSNTYLDDANRSTTVPNTIIVQDASYQTILDGLEELCDLVPVKCYTNGTNIYPNVTSSYRSYVVEAQPGHAYCIKNVGTCGNVCKVAITTNDPRTAVGTTSYASDVSVYNYSNKANGMGLYCKVPESLTGTAYIVIHYTTSNQSGITWSVKDVTSQHSYLFSNANLNTNNGVFSTYTVYYRRDSLANGFGTPGWSKEVIVPGENFTFNGCAINIYGSDQKVGPFTLIDSIVLGDTDATLYSTALTFKTREYSDCCKSCQCSTPYKYYTVDFDVSNATDARITSARAIAAPMLAQQETVSKYLDDAPSTALSFAPAVNIYYEGAGINFTSAPANGAIITMDANVDRPFKNSNFVMDLAITLAF